MKHHTIHKYSIHELLSLNNKTLNPPECLKSAPIYIGNSNPVPKRTFSQKKMIKKKQSKPNGSNVLIPSKNAWSPEKSISDADRVYRDAQGILNLLTREKYSTIKALFLRVPISSDLDRIISLIFNTCINNHNYCDMYADLCKDLVHELPTHDNTNKNFHRKILNLCQQEFMTEFPKGIDPTQRSEETMNKIRHAKKGNLIFIGELLKREMIAERIVHEIVRMLLGSEIPTEFDIELVIKLFDIVGKTLDQRHKPTMTHYMDRLSFLYRSANYSSRTRFMILDLTEFRNRDWVPRIKVVKAKTIKEVHEEAAKDKRTQEKVIARIKTTASEKVVLSVANKTKPGFVKAQVTRTKVVIEKRLLASEKELVQLKASRLVREYLVEGDRETTLGDVKALGYDDLHMQCLIKTIVEESFERKESEQNEVSSLMYYMRAFVCQKTFENAFTSALVHVVESELYVDIPHVFSIFARLIGRAVVDKIIPCAAIFRMVKEGTKNKLSTENADKVIVESILWMKQEIELRAEEGWRESLLLINSNPLENWRILYASSEPVKRVINHFDC
jgi:hypothetical protein